MPTCYLVGIRYGFLNIPAVNVVSVAVTWTAQHQRSATDHHGLANVLMSEGSASLVTDGTTEYPDVD